MFVSVLMALYGKTNKNEYFLPYIVQLTYQTSHEYCSEFQPEVYKDKNSANWQSEYGCSNIDLASSFVLKQRMSLETRLTLAYLFLHVGLLIL